MKRGFVMVSRLRGVIDAYCIRGWVRSEKALQRHADLMLFTLGVGLIFIGTTQLAMAEGGTFSQACGRILGLAEGAFGALVCAVAGVAAVVAAAMGGFKMAWTLIVVSVGSFILRSYVSIFNGTCPTGG
jgi:hypothetical protein